jgi:hypothetical protein
MPADKRQKINSVLVEVVTLANGSPVIYAGLLKHYEVMPDADNLSCLTLRSVSRINMLNSERGPIIPVPGHSLTIFGKDIINVNVTYMELITDPADPAKRKLSPIL